MPIDKLPEDYTFPPVGRCIYCGATEGKMTREHIIPLALNGNLKLPRASCGACADKTREFEQLCTAEEHGMFFSIRARLGMKSRQGSTKRGTICTEVIGRDGTRSRKTFRIDDLPVAIYQWKLPPAGILIGRDPATEITTRKLISYWQSPKGLGQPFLETKGDTAVGTFAPEPFLQLLAKIGYSFAAGAIGPQNLMPELADLILTKHPRHTDYTYLIGTDEFDLPYSPICPSSPPAHRLEDVKRVASDGQTFSLVKVHIFQNLGFPEYHVVVGRCGNQ
jgi:hypothetical protein